MDKIARLRQEIERLIEEAAKEIDKSKYNSEEMVFHRGELSALYDLFPLLDTLEPSLPSDVDEVAQAYERNNRCSVLGSVDIIDAFKAGAEYETSKYTLIGTYNEDEYYIKKK